MCCLQLCFICWCLSNCALYTDVSSSTWWSTMMTWWWHDDTYLSSVYACMLAPLLSSKAFQFESCCLPLSGKYRLMRLLSSLLWYWQAVFFSFCCMLFFAFVHCLYVCSAQSTICSFFWSVYSIPLKQTTVHVAVYGIKQAKLTLQFLLLFFGLFLFLYTQVHTFMKYLVSVYSISVWLYPQASQATFSQGWETVLSILDRMRVWCI